MSKCTWDKERKTWVIQGYKNGKRKKFYNSDKTKKGQQQCYAEYYKWLEQISDPKSIKLNDAWEEYIEYYSKSHKATTTDKMNQLYKTYLLNTLGNKVVSSISKANWQETIDIPYRERNLSYGYLKKFISLIKNFCIFCAGKGYMSDSEVPLFLLNPAKNEKRKKRALYPDELNKLFNSKDENWYLEVFQFLIYTGLRRGELCALQYKRDFKPPYLYIRENYVMLSTGIHLTTPKSNKEREEYLIPQAIKCIEKHREKCEQKGFNGENIFLSPVGKRINPKTLSEEWRKFRKANSLGDITLHELRHTFATYSNKKLNLEDLKRVLGHSKYMDTLNTYVHEIPLSKEEQIAKENRDKEIAQKISEIFDLLSD